MIRFCFATDTTLGAVGQKYTCIKFIFFFQFLIISLEITLNVLTNVMNRGLISSLLCDIIFNH